MREEMLEKLGAFVKELRRRIVDGYGYNSLPLLVVCNSQGVLFVLVVLSSRLRLRDFCSNWLLFQLLS
jgi:hypothetical protein